ncbi:MAG: HPr family phosphocarrier protein [Clostridia bacterium]|nr:HPr family phosphocarrier protein [Clostridia bacterium]
MNTFNIKLSTIEDIRKFVEIVTRQDYDIDLSSGRYVVDAKSIMGIFSLDLMNKILLTAHTENVDALKAELADYIVA